MLQAANTDGKPLCPAICEDGGVKKVKEDRRRSGMVIYIHKDKGAGEEDADADDP